MIQKETMVNVIDNTGVKKICCIHVIGGYRKKYAKTGDLIIGAVKTVKNKENLKIKKGAVTKALIVRTKLSGFIKQAGRYSLKCTRNAAILLSNQNKLLGSRVFGPIDKKFRYTRFSRLLMFCSHFR